jgi:hypothetical protein
MAEFYKSTVFLTIFTGTTIFVLGQIILKLFIEPIIQLRRTIGEVAYSLGYYANVITNPQKEEGQLDKRYMDCRGKLRELSMRITADYKAILIPVLAAIVRMIPSMDSLSSASANLILLSNTVGEKLPKEAAEYGSPIFCDKHMRQVLSSLGVASEEDKKILREIYKVL